MKFEAGKILSYIKSVCIARIPLGRSCSVKRSRFRGIIRPGGKSVIRDSYLSGDVSTGEKCKILDSTLIGDIRIGRFTSINGPNTDIYAKLHPVEIGSFTSIARNVSFQEYNHKVKRLSTYLMGQNVFGMGMEEDIESKGPVKVGNDVWIGSRVTVLGGVTIGDGAIIASNSLVNSDIPPYAIAGGIPAKVIKYRFSETVIDRLLNIKWWDWKTEKLRQQKELFLKEDISPEDLEPFL